MADDRIRIPDDGERDPKPYKVYQLDKAGGQQVKRVAEYATQIETERWKKRLDGYFAVLRRPARTLRDSMADDRIRIPWSARAANRLLLSVPKGETHIGGANQRHQPHGISSNAAIVHAPNMPDQRDLCDIACG
jgi:hypothetical protein